MHHILIKLNPDSKIKLNPVRNLNQIRILLLAQNNIGTRLPAGYGNRIKKKWSSFIMIITFACFAFICWIK